MSRHEGEPRGLGLLRGGRGTGTGPELGAGDKPGDKSDFVRKSGPGSRSGFGEGSPLERLIPGGGTSPERLRNNELE